jgi:hypothetical protein
LAVLVRPVLKGHLDCIVSIGILCEHDHIPADCLNHLLFNVWEVELLDGVLDYRKAIRVFGESPQVLDNLFVDLLEMGMNIDHFDEFDEDMSSVFVECKFHQILLKDFSYIRH